MELNIKIDPATILVAQELKKQIEELSKNIDRSSNIAEQFRSISKVAVALTFPACDIAARMRDIQTIRKKMFVVTTPTVKANSFLEEFADQIKTSPFMPEGSFLIFPDNNARLNFKNEMLYDPWKAAGWMDSFKHSLRMDSDTPTKRHSYELPDYGYFKQYKPKTESEMLTFKNHEPLDLFQDGEPKGKLLVNSANISPKGIVTIEGQYLELPPKPMQAGTPVPAFNPIPGQKYRFANEATEYKELIYAGTFKDRFLARSEGSEALQRFEVCKPLLKHKYDVGLKLYTKDGRKAGNCKIHALGKIFEKEQYYRVIYDDGTVTTVTLPDIETHFYTSK